MNWEKLKVPVRDMEVFGARGDNGRTYVVCRDQKLAGKQWTASVKYQGQQSKPFIDLSERLGDLFDCKEDAISACVEHNRKVEYQ